MEKINILDVIKRLADRETFNLREKTENEKAQKKMKEMGISSIGNYAFEIRNLMPNVNLVGTETKGIYGKSANAEILQNMIYFEGLTNNIKLPYISVDGVQWCGYNMVENNDVITTKLTPHRLATSVTITREWLNNTEQFNEAVKTLLWNAVYAKLTETMFSTAAATSLSPAGLFGGVTEETISSLEDLINLQYDGDKNKCENVWVISPKAKKFINSQNNGTLITNNKLFNNDIVCCGGAEDGIIGYIPLNYVAVGQWGCGSITVDAVTRAKEGEIIVYIDTYWDFANLNNDFVKVGRIAD